MITKDYTFTLSATSRKVLDANPKRLYALLINDSGTEVYLRKGTINAVYNEGIRLNTNGGNYEISLVNPYFGEIHAIGTAAAETLLITEDSK